MRGRFVLCRRTRAWQILDGLRGRGESWERRVLRRASAKRLRVETPATDGAGREPVLRRVARIAGRVWAAVPSVADRSSVE